MVTASVARASVLHDQSAWRDLNRWRRRVISDAGPKQSTMRLLLLVLATHSDANLICYPSERTLAAEAALTVRAVRKHLQAAECDGWISRTRAAYKRGRWWHTVYQLTNPAISREEPRSSHQRTHERNYVPSREEPRSH